MNNKIFVLKNIIQEYAWGSKTAISSLLGHSSPSDRPQAELWMGAHPKAASKIFFNDKWIFLTDAIKKDPIGFLGRQAAERFSNKLPFLFKVLAANCPLSIQVHPDRDQACEGFEKENKLGISLNDFQRNYRDNNHKPELICALTPFWAMKGFRVIPEILEFMNICCGAELKTELEAFMMTPDIQGLKYFFQDLMTMRKERQKDVVAAAVERASDFLGMSSVWDWIIKLNKKYPNDIGVLSPLFLNLIELQPGEAMYLPAGEIHSYLKGTAIELMANSDNVIRGGLTQKHIDLPELLKTLTFNTEKIEILLPEQQNRAEQVYLTDAEEFVLSIIRVNQDVNFISEKKRNIELILCIEGEAIISGQHEDISVKKGISIMIPAFVKKYYIQGNAVMYKASVSMPGLSKL
ncbi:Mannose-6-phosphate isomerase [Candidatus Magnetomoraceae bacterium gMMP-15]